MDDLVHVVCPHCDTINRLPRAKLAAGARCGECHKPLFEGHPIALEHIEVLWLHVGLQHMDMDLKARRLDPPDPAVQRRAGAPPGIPQMLLVTNRRWLGGLADIARPAIGGGKEAVDAGHGSPPEPW